MKVFRVLLMLMITHILNSCVERYYPQEDDSVTGTLVVNAHLTNKPGVQTIQISRSDRLLYPEYVPELNCIVEVENQEGRIMEFKEQEPGEYTADIPADFLRGGSLYRLLMQSSDGNRYESEFTQLHLSTQIDSVYYELESQASTDPDEPIDGIRYYIDFEIDPDSSEFMRWELFETYEFHNPNYEGYIYSYDRVLKPIPDSLSDRQCWITGFVNAIYTLDAGNMNDNEFKYMPLHFVSNETQRLSYGYSLLVRQFSMDEPAFRYWDELKKNSQEMSGMFDRQPSFTPGNICNCEDPEERILGFFSISGVTEERIFVKDVEGLEKYDVLFCFPYPEMPRLRYMLLADLPVYISRAVWPLTGEERFGETVHECLDCRVRKRSSGDPPDYWPIQ